MVKEIKRNRFGLFESFLIDILENLKIKEQTKYPNSIFYELEGRVMFEINSSHDANVLYFHYDIKLKYCKYNDFSDDDDTDLREIIINMFNVLVYDKELLYASFGYDKEFWEK